MKKRKKIIKDKKMRGEWAESVFMVRAGENGLPVSKPWGDSKSFDCVVGRPGKFAAVQVKSTIAKLETGKGYICSVCSSHKVYEAGAFDFLVAYVIPEDAWYIVPAEKIRGLKSISLCTREGRYEEYREAWHLLREAAGNAESSDDSLLATPGRDGAPRDSGTACDEGVGEPAAMPMGPGVARMQNAFNFFRRQLERGGVVPQKPPGEVDPNG